MSITLSAVLFILRLCMGAVFLFHGIQKLPLWRTKHSDTMPDLLLRILRIVSPIEIVGSILLVLGLFTHVAAGAFFVIMLGALYFKIIVWKKGFSGNGGWELDLILLALALFLFVNGAGALSLDQMKFLR